MKKFMFGVLVFIVGLVFSAFCFMYAVFNPCDYNGISGLLGAFLGADLLIPFILSLIVLIAGLLICGDEAYHRK